MNLDRLSLAELRDLAEAVAGIAGATEVGLFDELARRAASSEELAERLDLDRRAVGILLPLLRDLGFLDERGGRFRPSERGRRELVDRESADYAAGGLPLWLANLQAWTRLPEAMRSGSPVALAAEGDEGETAAGREERLERFMAGMAAAPASRVGRLVDLVLSRHPEARRLLDLGGGPGHISRAFLDLGVEATLVDLPETASFVMERYGLGAVDGLRVVGADFLEDPLPGGPFDVILLSNILHMLGPEDARGLVARAAKVAAPGAVIAVADFFRDVSPRASRFAVVMLLRTAKGNTYTVDQHVEWFEAAGFREPVLEALDEERHVLTARLESPLH